MIPQDRYNTSKTQGILQLVISYRTISQQYVIGMENKASTRIQK